MITVLVFIPDILQSKEIGFLQGFIKKTAENVAFYITDTDISAQSGLNTIGYCSFKKPEENLNALSDSEWIHVNSKTGEVNVCNFKEDHKLLCVVYDYVAFMKSEVVNGKYFKCLSQGIKLEKSLVKENKWKVALFTKLIAIILKLLLSFLRKFDKATSYSTTFLHFKNTLITFEIFIFNLINERKIKLKTKSFLYSKLFDFFIGLLCLYYFFLYEKSIVNFIETTGEAIIEHLKWLLKELMGSPAGLKLNFAFNKTLGIFFFYNISLWKAFLQAMNPILKKSLHLLILPGFFGFTFQVALLADFISFATFHVYCIYVYAARLYWLQVKIMISLWRLFMGRKYNPLRKRVDSCKYTYQQLFIGTLGFTVFLFLFPTTLLYYTVFTMFRVIIVFVKKFLYRIRKFGENFPLYPLALWIMRSSKVAGSVEVNYTKKKSQRVLFVTIEVLPLNKIIPCLQLDVNLKTEDNLSVKTIFQNVFSGILF